MIPLSSKKGKEIFLQTANSSKPYTDSYFDLSQNFETQTTGSLCGPTSLVVVLNSIPTTKNHRPISTFTKDFYYFDQKNLFNETESKKIGESVLKRGVSFKEYEQLLNFQKGVTCKAYLGHQSTLQDFKNICKEAFLNNSHVIIYYDRSLCGEMGILIN
jgi:hypothetical protein